MNGCLVLSRGHLSRGFLVPSVIPSSSKSIVDVNLRPIQRLEFESERFRGVRCFGWVRLGWEILRVRAFGCGRTQPPRVAHRWPFCRSIGVLFWFFFLIIVWRLWLWNFLVLWKMWFKFFSLNFVYDVWYYVIIVNVMCIEV